MEINFKVPTGWQSMEIREIGEVVTGRTPSTKREEFYGGQYKLISPIDLDNGKYVTTAHRWLTSVGFRECRALPKDTVLVGCIGNVGKLGMVQDVKAATNQQINAVICNQNNDPHFVYYSFYANRVRLEQASDKTTIPILNKTNFEAFRIPVPSLQEQRMIAAMLGLVQRAIEQQKRLLALIAEMKKVLLHQLFTRGLRNEPQKQTEIGPIPQSWSIGTLQDVKLEQKGAIVSGPFGSNIGKRFFVESGVPLIRGCNLTKGEQLFVERGFVFITEQKAQELNGCQAIAGDLIFTAAGTLGQVGIIPADCLFPKYVISNKQLRARIDPTRAVGLYLFYWFTTDIIQSLIAQRRSGSSIPVINLSILRNLPIPLPQTIEEQEEIASAISSIDATRAIYGRKCAVLSALFHTLLHDLMTARIRVNDVDLSMLNSQK